MQESAGLATPDGRKVTAVIRPENFALAGDSTTDPLTGMVEVGGHLGNERLVYLRIPGAVVRTTAETPGSTARLPASAKIALGQALTLAVHTSQIHVFYPATTNRFV